MPGNVSQADIENLHQLLVGKYLFLAAATLTYYDHLVMFSTEVQVVWKRPKTYLTWMFFFVRYYSPLSVAVIAFAYFSTAMTREMCKRWIYFLPFGFLIPLNISSAILMIIRVYALYNRNKLILLALVLYLVAQSGAGFWLYAAPGATAAPLILDNYEFHFCVYLPPKNAGNTASLYVVLELVFDSLVFLLTVMRTIYMHVGCGGVISRGRRVRRMTLFTSLVRDGAFYFAAIFSVNLLWVIMILHGPTALRSVFGVPSGCFISSMICRITLNLRSTAYGPPNLDERTGIVGREAIPLEFMRRRRADYAADSEAGNVERDRESLDAGAVKSTRMGPDGDTSGSSGRDVDELPFSSGNGYGEYPYTVGISSRGKGGAGFSVER